MLQQLLRMRRALLVLFAGVLVTLFVCYFFGGGERSDVAAAERAVTFKAAEPTRSHPGNVLTDKVSPLQTAEVPSQHRMHALSQMPVSSETTSASADQRLQLRWGRAGLCIETADGDVANRRASLIRRFSSASRGELSFAFDASVQPEALAVIERAIVRTRHFANSVMGWVPQAFPPRVVVYRDAEQLRQHACLNPSAVGYYDGEIHLSGDLNGGSESLRQSAVHEYVHHVLLVLGVQKPMWLHEGLAMRLAEETWWSTPSLGLPTWLRQQHLPFRAMVESFPHSADERFAAAAYYQSLMMLRFVVERRGVESLRQVIDALASGAVSADLAFTRAAGLDQAELEPVWAAFIASGGDSG
jgi:hypothetical protein